MKRVRLKISTLSLQVTSDWIDIRTRLFSIPQTWRFVVFGRITGVTGVDRSGLGGKSGGHSVYNFFHMGGRIIYAYLYFYLTTVGRKKELGVENSIGGVHI